MGSKGAREGSTEREKGRDGEREGGKMVQRERQREEISF